MLQQTGSKDAKRNRENSLKILILQNCEYERLGTYERYLADSGMTCDVVHTYRESLPDPNKYGMLLIGGTPDSAYTRSQIPYLAQVCETLSTAVDANIPCFGVCCGAQLLAEIIGGRVYRNPEMEIGGYRVTLTPDGRNDPLLRGFPRDLPVFHWHGDTFDLPDGGELLATSGECPHQAFRFRNAYGLQFHVEVTGPMLLEWFGNSERWPYILSRYLVVKDLLHRRAGKVFANFLSLAGVVQGAGVR